jgi:hypothetical protein
MGAEGHLVARWVFLRALGGIYFSAFFALLFQVKGLIGEQGILPAGQYLEALRGMGWVRFWDAPTLLWFSASNHWLMTVVWVGLAASVLLAANVWPRRMLAVCFVCFLSFVAAAQDFSGYQSDGMLLEAGFLSWFVAPAGLWPGLGRRSPGVLAAYLLLLWEWFRIYFESGVVKLASGDPTWRNLTAMYEYYQNGPLPTWVGWYIEQLPHWFQRATARLTLGMELGLVWLCFAGRRGRIVCAVVVTAWQAGVIATANYAFLNYLVLALGVLLVDDRGWGWVAGRAARVLPLRPAQGQDDGVGEATADFTFGETALPRMARWVRMKMAAAGLVLTLVFYVTLVPLVQMFWQGAPLPAGPVAWLDPLRIANTYGLFAVMTPHRYEIEFQGSNDGVKWTAYPFRYKPQEVNERPRIYAPYQPRFDWNLWFASLGTWEQNPMVPRTQELLLKNDKDVLGLFGGDPFDGHPPKYVRTMLWQYWFSTAAEKRASGAWWRRELVGVYSPAITIGADGRFAAVESGAPANDEP